MTKFLFIRHGQTDETGSYLCGRGENISLNRTGREQAETLSRFLRPLRVHAVYSSPRARAMETALFLTEGRNFRACSVEDLDEVNFGAWTGRSFSALNSDPEWIQFNQFREFKSAPDGESSVEVQARITRLLNCLCRRHAGEIVGLVTHGDVIRVALLICLGAPLNLIERLEIFPASMSVVELDSSWTRVITLNYVPNRLPTS